MKFCSLFFSFFIFINSHSQKLQEDSLRSPIIKLTPNGEAHYDTISKAALENKLTIIITPYQANCIVQSFEVVYATAKDSLVRKTFAGDKVVIDLQDEFFKWLKEPGNDLLQVGQIYALHEKRRVKLPSLILFVRN